jgi:hypothetical protein
MLSNNQAKTKAIPKIVALPSLSAVDIIKIAKLDVFEIVNTVILRVEV